MIFTLKKEKVGPFGIPESSPSLQTYRPDDSAVCANSWFNQMQYIFFLYTDVGFYILSWV